MGDERGVPDLAREVLDAQDACNLSGVILAWGRSIRRLRKLLPKAGTETINEHPINRLWADKAMSLTRMDMSRDMRRVMDAVEEMAKWPGGRVMR